MTAPKVRADYDPLQTIAQQFDQQAHAIQQTLRQIQDALNTLQQGDWVGAGANQFYAEMASAVLPSIKRLQNALETAAQTTRTLIKIMKEAEDMAAQIFRIIPGVSPAGSVTGVAAGVGAGASGTAPGATGSAAAGASGAQAGAVGGAQAGAPGAAAGAAGAVSISPGQLRQAMPGLSQARAEQFAPILNNAMNEFGINTPARRNMFLAQIGHESGDLTTMVENLNYSRARLLQVWPNRFNEANVDAYAHHPERIANHVYANRLGNGDEASGDGWRYRGRGAIQLTGRDNYAAAGRALGLDLVNHPELLEQPQDAIRASAWWWQNRGLNQRVDQNPNDVQGVTRVINGGLGGLADRQARFDRINHDLGN